MNTQLRIIYCLIVKSLCVLSTVSREKRVKLKKGQFIGWVNKLISNFQYLQRNVLARHIVAPFTDHEIEFMIHDIATNWIC